MNARILLASLVVVSGFGSGSVAAQQDGDPLAPPRNGPRAVDVAWTVIRGATLYPRPGTRIEGAAVELRDGRIVRVLTGTAAMADVPGARVVDRTGLHVYAGFLDPYVEVETPAPDVNAPGAHWSARVTPQRSALDGSGLDADGRKDLRKLGFCAAAIAPKGGIFRGSAALVPLSDPPADQPPSAPAYYAANVYQSVAFEAAGFRGRPGADPRREPAEDVSRWDRYPGSLMGAIALIRQTFHDAAWQRALLEAKDPRFTPSALDAIVLGPSQRFVFDASDELDVLRAAKVAREFGRPAIVLGSGREFRRLQAIAGLGLPLIVPLDFPTRPKIESVGDAEATDLRELMAWEQAPTNPRRLDALGVTVALTTSKARERGKFLESVREAIKAGLPEDRALAMLTVEPARILDVAGPGGFGTIEPDRVANLVVTDGPVFAKESKVREVWIDGRVHEVVAPPANLRGEWTVTAEPPLSPGLRVTIGKSDRVQVHVGDVAKRARESRVSPDRIAIVTDAAVAEGAPGLSTWTGMVEGAAMAGSGTLADGRTFHWTAVRIPGSETREVEDREGAASRPESQPASRPAEEHAADVPDRLGHPFGPYALETLPAQPDSVLFAGGRVWTSGPAGVIEDGYVLVSRGKVAAVGSGRPARVPEGSLVVDTTGRHVTPGLIDCHSHTGISRGVNEGGQAVSAEVRIEDVTDPDSIAWYRQLAGGITAVNSLHGSANAIGGQNRVNKVRWGVPHPDEMHLQGAPPGIKFALGENPKHSNAGDRNTTRYPQTRMGVEALLRDRFVAAREYAAAWRAFEDRGRKGAPPRRDLELEALAEVLSGKRLVHCHSYRQDEILMLCRVAGEFGFTIGTFQHVLEGYKVADEIKKTALGASAFSDWWAYKVEVQDAIPDNGAIMHEVGVCVSFNSDSDELARRMNVEAAKAVKYGGVTPAEALKFVTLNPARQLGVDDRIGSLEPGKDADLAVWSDDPLSTRARCEQTWVDGRRYFSLEDDAAARQRIAAERRRLIQKVLDATRREGGPDRGDPSASDDTDRGRRGRGRPGTWDEYRSGSDGFMRPGDCGCGEQEDWR
jgi:N-acetylglucosamine-6-phosphate deacetylase